MRRFECAGCGRINLGEDDSLTPDGGHVISWGTEPVKCGPVREVDDLECWCGHFEHVHEGRICLDCGRSAIGSLGSEPHPFAPLNTSGRRGLGWLRYI